MTQEPMMRLQTPNARARRQAIREQLTYRIKNLADQNEKLDKDIEELGLGDFLKKKIKKVLGKEDKPKPKTNIAPEGSSRSIEQRGGSKSDFDEKKHPRAEDGRFAKAPAGSTNKQKGLLDIDFIQESKEEIGIDRKMGCRSGKKGEKVDTPTTNRVKLIGKEDPLLNKVIPIKVKVNGQVCSVKTKSGKDLSLYETGSNKLTADKKREMLNALADLHEMYPNWPKSKIVVSPLSERAIGLASYKDNVMAVSSDYSFDGKDSGMEYLSKTPVTRSVVYHEFGHIFDGKRNGEGINNLVFGGATRKLFKDKNIRKHLSPYAQTNEFEAYAEAFAEWHLSKGKSKNPGVLAYARHQKWYSFSVGKSPGESALSLLQELTFAIEEQPKGLIFIDTFDPKKGSEIIGNPTFKELTPEEDAIIDKIIREAFKEAGVPYDE